MFAPKYQVQVSKNVLLPSEEKFLAFLWDTSTMIHFLSDEILLPILKA